MNDEIEALAAEVHKIYCAQYEKNFSKPYRTNGDYALLDEPTKDYDRAFVRWHLEKVRAIEMPLIYENERWCNDLASCMSERNKLIEKVAQLEARNK